MSIPQCPPIAADHGRLAALDALRFFAAIAVLGFHYFFRGSAEPALLDHSYPEVAGVALYGYLGVSLFFMISGFVIAWSAQARSAPLFALLRFARIYPAFVICMSVSFLVMALAGDKRFAVSVTQWFANLFIFSPAVGYGFVDGVYWSIVLELIFYGWVTLAIATGLFQARPLTLIAGWLILSALNEFVLQSGAIRLLLVTEYSGWFAAGILVHRLRVTGLATMPLMLFAAAMLLATATSFKMQAWMIEHYAVALSDGHLIAAVVSLFLLFIATVVWGSKLRSSPSLLALGSLTYPLYLLHQNVGYILLNTLSPHLNHWIAAGVVIIGMLALSYAIYRWFEAPVRRWLVTRSNALLMGPTGTSHDSQGNKALSA
jgi:peptidoglycan/LPS O-acetylase OafA/YrhL